MEDLEFLDDDLLKIIDFDNLFDDSFDSSSPDIFSNPSPGSVSPWIGEIETMLMKDNDEGLEPNQQFLDDFVSDILIDSPASGGEAADLPTDKEAALEKDKLLDTPPIENVNSHTAEPDDPIAKKRRRYV